jgi:hypothetical protein
MSTEQDVASPAAAVLERRQRRTTPQKRKQVCSDSDSEESETGSDGEWSGKVIGTLPPGGGRHSKNTPPLPP